MSELYAKISGIYSVAQALRNEFPHMSVPIQGVDSGSGMYMTSPVVTTGDPVNTNTGAAKLQAYMYRAHQLARGCKTFKDYKLDDVTKMIMSNVESYNLELRKVADFLEWLLEQHEHAEAEIASTLGDLGVLGKADADWVANYRISTGHEMSYGGLIGSFIQGEFDSPFVGEADKYGIDFSIISFKGENIRRTEDGQRVESDGEVRIGSVTAVVGGETVRDTITAVSAVLHVLTAWTDDPVDVVHFDHTGDTSHGFSVGLGILSASETNKPNPQLDGRGETGSANASGWGMTYMATRYEDGGYEVNGDLPGPFPYGASYTSPSPNQKKK